MDLSHLLTEQHRPELADLDIKSTAELIDLMVVDQGKALGAFGSAADQIASAIVAVVAKVERGGRLFYVGAGTAGRLGLLDAAECPPTFTTDRVIGLMAGGTDGFLESKE